MKKQLNKFLILLLSANSIIAQKVTAKIDNIPSKDFYKISMSPEIRSASKSDFRDLRIFDSNHKETPYLIEMDNLEKVSQQFDAFKIISRKSIEKKQTSIIIENPLKKIDEITMEIANSDIVKTYNISGGNDGNQWFGLVNKVILSELENEDSISVFKNISLPLNSYKYLKIDFDDSKTLPINVLKIGTIKNKSATENYPEVKAKDLFTTQIPIEKKTRIKVTFKHPQDIDKVVFDISNPSLYNRETRIYTIENQTKNHKTKTIENEIANFNLTSNSKNDFTIICNKQKEIFIEIDNKDNELLTIASVQFYQKPTYIYAQLNADEAYTVETGNPNLEKPNYDLVYFQNYAKQVQITTGMTDIKYQTNSKKIESPKSFWQQSWFMWLCIAIAGITILLFSNSLIKDINNKS